MFKDALKSKQLYQLYIIMFIANCNFIQTLNSSLDYATFFSYIFKAYAQEQPNPISDDTLSWASSVSSIGNGIARLSLGFLYDYIGFKPIVFVLMVLQLINSLSAYFAVNITALYFICVVMNSFALGGIFAIFPACMTKVYGVTVGS
jgi:MFS family permease